LAERNFWTNDHKRPQFRSDQAIKGGHARYSLTDSWFSTEQQACEQRPHPWKLPMIECPHPVLVSDYFLWLSLSEPLASLGERAYLLGILE